MSYSIYIYITVTKDSDDSEVVGLQFSGLLPSVTAQILETYISTKAEFHQDEEVQIVKVHMQDNGAAVVAVKGLQGINHAWSQYQYVEIAVLYKNNGFEAYHWCSELIVINTLSKDNSIYMHRIRARQETIVYQR